MKTIYFNMKTVYGIETVDSICTEDWPDYKSFRNELKSMFQIII